MKLIAPRLQNRVHHAAAASSILSGGTAGEDFVFLDAVDAKIHSQDASWPGVRHVVYHETVDVIHRVVGTCAVDCNRRSPTPAAVLGGRTLKNTRLQGCELQPIAAVQWKFTDRLLAYQTAER